MATKTSTKKTKKDEAVEEKAAETKETAKAESKPAEKPAEATPKKETKKASSTKAPQTMEELLAQVDTPIVVPQKGQTVKGTITHKGKKSIVVDIGAKTEGVVGDKEFSLAGDFLEDLKEGDDIEAVVISAENDRGQVMLSVKQAAMDAKWDFFKEAMDNETIFEAKGIEVNKGGLIVVVEGMRGFVPSSQFGKQYMGKIKQLKGETVKIKAIEVDQEKNRLIFSERHVSEAKELAQRDQALQSVEEKAVYEGVVSGVMPFGLFVTVEVPVEGKEGSIGHVEGLIHISEISWEKVNDPKDYHKVGDRIQVKVLGVDEDSGKLNLSLKQLTDDPWTGIDEKYPVGTTFTGKVTRTEPFGVFVNVEAGVDGLIHASKLSGQTFAKDEEVTVTVESVEPTQRRMSLSVVTTELPVGYK